MEGRTDFGILDAITHAVRAVDRRNDGLQSVAARHSAASAAALKKFGTADFAAAPVSDRPGARLGR